VVEVRIDGWSVRGVLSLTVHRKCTPYQSLTSSVLQLSLVTLSESDSEILLDIQYFTSGTQLPPATLSSYLPKTQHFHSAPKNLSASTPLSITLARLLRVFILLKK
jgi:hypothetical protein